MHRRIESTVDYLKVNTNYLLLVLLWLFHLINNHIWLKKDTTPLKWDSGWHYLQSLQYFDILSHPSIHSLSELVNVGNSWWPPFARLLPSLFYVFGREPDTAVFIAGGLFSFILIFSVYGLGRKLCNGNAGLLAAFIVTMYPIIVLHSRTFMLDMPLAAMVSLSLYVLLLTDDFKNRKYSMILGLMLGLGMLTKYAYIIFIAGPMALLMFYYLSGSINKTVKKFEDRTGELTLIIKKDEIIRNIIDSRNQILNFMGSLVIGASIASIWYVPHWSLILRKGGGVSARVTGIGEGDIGSSYLIGNVSYLIGNVSFLFFILFIVMLLLLIYPLIKSRSSELKDIVFLLVWIAIPFIVLSPLSAGTARYLAPLTPALALISAIGIEKVNKKIKVILVISIIIFGCIQFSAVSYGTPDLPKTKVTIDSSSFTLFSQRDGPKSNDWKTDEILQVINETKTSDRATIGFIPDNPFVNTPLCYYSYLYKLPFSFCPGANAGCPPNRIMKCDYVLTLKDKKGYWGGSDKWLHNQDIFEQKYVYYFKLIETIQLPDKSELLIYKYNANLGKSKNPDTPRVAITDITPSEEFYEPNKTMAVEISLMNIDTMQHNVSGVWWHLNSPGAEKPWEEAIVSGRYGSFDLMPGERKSILIEARVPNININGTFELNAYVHTMVNGTSKHSDGACYINNITIISGDPDKSEVFIYKYSVNLGKSKNPDTPRVAITDITPSEEFYEPNKTMAVEISLMNIDTMQHNVSGVWWHLNSPGAEKPWEEAIVSGRYGSFDLMPGERKSILIEARVPNININGTFELNAYVHTMVNGTSKHSDGACYINNIMALNNTIT